MVRSLWTAAAGMIGQQFNIDTIANNLSNVNTTGFKKNRPDFEDLLYQTLKVAGTPATEFTLVPTGIQVGLGVKAASTQKIFSQGSPQNTGNLNDVAIFGEGFFRVLLYDGSYGYTRDGAFKIDQNAQIVTSDGYRLVPEVILPEDFIAESLAITKDGRITVKTPRTGTDSIQVGQMELYRFINPAGLQAVGENIFKVSPASGDAIAGQPARDGMGQVMHQFLEMSNVSVAQEMVNMIVAQRAYEFNSKAIQTSDTMLGIAANLKR
ncbi:MAG: flagellar basal-body rod protein FlgG [Spirochaetales bacterium]|jgi:flagellar basal-body rod protein FlgG|nr:flagellar basal-body rod protein FlgG [Spirochaetales bacterium]